MLAEADTIAGQDPNSGMGVKTAHLKDRAITEPKLADSTVSTRTLQNNAVGQNNLQNNAVGQNNLQNNAVQSRALAPADPGVDQTLTTGAGVKSGHLKDGAVTAAKLADNAVSSAKLQSHPSDNAQRAVAKEHLRDGSVTIAKLSARVVFDGQVSVQPGPPTAVTFETLDALAFYLISVQYVGPRPPGPDTIARLDQLDPPKLALPIRHPRCSFTVTRWSSRTRTRRPAITVACKVYRVDET